MRVAIVLTLLMSSALIGAAAAAQDAPRSLSDLLKAQVEAPDGSHVNDPVVEKDALTSQDRAYDNVVLGAFQNAQARQGPLDGRWVVKTTEGVELYAFQFSDPGAGPARVEGVWRDPRVNGPTATGFVDDVTQQGGETVLAFQQAGEGRQLRLRSGGTGAWSGQVQQGSIVTTVLMLRDEGLETAAADAPAYTPPLPPKAKSKSRSKSKSKSKAKAPTLRK